MKMTLSKKVTRQLTHESFVETYGVITKTSGKDSQADKRRAMFSKLAKDASKIMRSVSLRKRPQPNPLRRCSTISAPDCFPRMSSMPQVNAMFEQEKSKLLQEVLAQREELLREQKQLEKMMDKTKSTKSNSKSSLQSLDNGYCSSQDDEDEISPPMMLSRRKSLSTSSLNTTLSSVDKQCFDISEEILAEIEEFELFTRQTLSKIAEEQTK